MIVQQKSTLVHNLFSNLEIGKMLQDKYQVLYYAEQILNNINDKEKIILRIPPELKTTVDDVIEKIQSLEKYYGYKKEILE